jgi:hypothetical protein
LAQQKNCLHQVNKAPVLVYNLKELFKSALKLSRFEFLNNNLYHLLVYLQTK